MVGLINQKRKGWMGIWTNEWTNGLTDRQYYRYTNIQRFRYRQTYRQTEKQRERWTNGPMDS